MRFRAPRSTSPSPVRDVRAVPTRVKVSSKGKTKEADRKVKRKYSRSTFRIPSEWSSSSDSGSDCDSDLDVSSRSFILGDSEDVSRSSRLIDGVGGSSSSSAPSSSSSSEGETDEGGEELSLDLDNATDDDGESSEVGSVKAKGRSLLDLSKRNRDLERKLAKPAHHREMGSEEEMEAEETIASIRMRMRYKDPYDEWEREMRKDAFRTARQNQASTHVRFRTALLRSHQEYQTRRKLVQTRELEELDRRLAYAESQTRLEEQRLRDAWKERDRVLWERIEGVIRFEEEKARKKAEEERKRREVEEAARMERERKLKEEEDRKKRAEEERLKQEKEENEKKEGEERDKKEREERAKKVRELEQGLESTRALVGCPRSEELWITGLRSKQQIKEVVMPVVKGPRPPEPKPDNWSAPMTPIKKKWSGQRRKMTPRIGQLTNDPREIARISEELRAIVTPSPSDPSETEVYHHALLATLAKVILLQAEAEVSAHKEQAIPLAQVTVNLMSYFPVFGDIFWGRLCGMVGCWVGPVEVGQRETEMFGPKDLKGHQQLTQKQLRKMWSVRDEENEEAQVNRITGVMRLYFTMMFTIPIVTDRPLLPQFRPSRVWSFIATLFEEKGMLERTVAAEVLFVALDVAGHHALKIWGKQWVKLMAFIYEAVKSPLTGPGLTPMVTPGSATANTGQVLVGGDNPLAQAGRARCRIEIEKILTG